MKSYTCCDGNRCVVFFYWRCAAHIVELAQVSTASVNHHKLYLREETSLALAQTQVSVVATVVGLVSWALAPLGLSDETALARAQTTKAVVATEVGLVLVPPGSSEMVTLAPAAM
jgi:hypothetical protein